jgi:hypothetical protein
MSIERFERVQFINIHTQRVPSEAREWESYWKNRLASKIYSQMHPECLSGTHSCNACIEYRIIADIIKEEN